MLDDLLRDFRFAVRSLSRTPAVTLGALFSIALGIAASTAVFSVVDAAIFRPPPFHDVDRLAMIYATRAAPGEVAEPERWSWPRSRLLQSIRSFDHVASFSRAVLAYTGDEPEPATAEMVSSSYWATLGVSMQRGRDFSSEDDVGAGAHPFVILSDDAWRLRYGASESVLGRVIAVNGVALTVIGIAPRGFRGLSGEAQLWIPATMAPRVSYADYLTTDQSFISVIGHLRPQTTFDAARAELAVAGRNIARQIPMHPSNPATQYAATLVPLADARIDPTTRRALVLLSAAAVCLLALACANVAGLLVGRGVSRRREIAIRIATGASRRRIVAQLLTEASVLALTGGALGVLLALPFASRLQLPAAPANWTNFYRALAEFTDPRIDLRVAVFAIVLCALTSLAFGVLPALRASRVDPAHDLREGARSGGARGGIVTRRTIVAIESLLAVALLFSAGLLTASGYRLTKANVGFDPSHLLSFLIRPSDVSYPPPKAAQLITRVLEAIERVPGVEAASVDGCAPVGAGCANSTLYILGRPVPSRDAAPPVLRHYIGPDHFKTLGVPLLRGRAFNANDRAGSNRVAIINQTAARRFWPNEDPIGQRVWFGGGSNFDRPDSSAEIVGIVGDVAYQHLDRHPFQPDFYTPFAQFTYASRTVLVRSRIAPAALLPEIRRAVRSADPDLALFDVRTMDDLVAQSWAPLTYQTRLFVAFSAAALSLAAMGVFAVITNIVSDQRRNIGIRVALGASPTRVLASVGDQGARPAIVGACLGLAVALAIGRVLAAALYGVRAFEPAVALLVMSTTLLIIVATTFLAARRALSIDAAEALRST